MEVDRFLERDEIKNLLSSNSYSTLDIWYQIKISKAYPHTQFQKVQLLETAIDDFISCSNRNPDISFSLLNQYLADSRQGSLREAFYVGIMFLEDLFYIEISKHKFAFTKTQIKKKLPVKSLAETSFRNKIAILRDNNLYDQKLLKQELKKIAHLRNEVFHRGYNPNHNDLFELHRVVAFFLSIFTNINISELMISNQYILFSFTDKN